MPRKLYLSDLEEVINGGAVIPNIADVQRGEESGQFTFLYTSTDAPPVSISALIPDVSDYPSAHTYMLFAGEDAPQNIAIAIENLPSTSGKSVKQLLEVVSLRLSAELVTDDDGDVEMTDSQISDDLEEEEDFSEDDDNWGLDDNIAPTSRFSTTSYQAPTRQPKVFAKIRPRLRSDLQAVKDAGFKMGVHGSISAGDSCFVSVSCRVSKLGISDEAMQAWQLESHEYLVLLIRYPHGYESLEDLIGYQSHQWQKHVEMRVGKCSSYKPTYREAIHAFSNVAKDKLQSEVNADEGQANTTNGFGNIFISKPINQLLNERLVSLIRFRYQGMTWAGAESYYIDHQARNATTDNALDDKYLLNDDATLDLPGSMSRDHIEAQTSDHSFPVLAMQFLLRHIIHCTEFCLVCHCRLDNDLEAIKPYVCENPLCLYQYMSLGFGPSIEHEVIAQPHVVDLLVSFCYSRAATRRLKDFPSGLSLSVAVTDPSVGDTDGSIGHSSYAPQPQPFSSLELSNGLKGAVEMRFDEAGREMIFEKGQSCPVRKGDWIVIQAQSSETLLDCRIDEISLFPVVKVSQPIARPNTLQKIDERGKWKTTKAPNVTTKPVKVSNPTPATTPLYEPASFIKYDQNFDELPESQKCLIICQLLNTLPTVTEMQDFLSKTYSLELRDWVDRISPAALGILRWIIASNRACIVQVDTLCKEDEVPVSSDKKPEDRLHGMRNWIQFRFAMGAPDKEKRFRNAVQSNTERLNLSYPTIFAWHGSPLHNWHSIIREGLHFKETHHGRAFGHGCYHAMECNTSITYSGGYNGSSVFSGGWPQSELKIETALSLNEIVNAPNEFVNRSPYLVVAQLDWIQTRYLFVRSSSGLKPLEREPLTQIHPQDPSMTPLGEAGQELVIPASAVAKYRRTSALGQLLDGANQLTGGAFSKIKNALGTQANPFPIIDDDDEDNISIATLAEDLDVLNSPSPPSTPTTPTPTSKTLAPKPPGLMDFTPGTLTKSTLPLIPSPTYATTSASKRLQSDLRSLLRTQDTTPLHELGWYIDPNLLDDNLYQWIIELHSFPTSLPLSKDMSTANLSSIILELRFGGQYPMTPPFVRVLRPRFLSFMQGGGGHVTAGGALCMELLTNSGWSAVSSIESVLMQVRMAILSEEPKPARLAMGSGAAGAGGGEYGVAEAAEAFVRACRTHGWAVPEGFAELAGVGRVGEL
ncbi:MAG: hypothetical protein M1820_010315 [Bogoriella megaspora]|nr:MAG: hypothetical protein M1820_010315 [Bogoriella megaspora]